MIFWGEGPPEKFSEIKDAHSYEVIVLWILGLAIIILGFWPRLALDLIDGTTPDYLARVVGDIATGGGR